MGAMFQYYLSEVPKEDLVDFHFEFQTQECELKGTDTYGGHIGIMPYGINFTKAQPFATKKEAISYLEDNHIKWEQAMAVPFMDEVLDYDKKSKGVRKNIEKIELEILDLKAKILQSIRSTKSKTIGCKNVTVKQVGNKLV